jgi:hypothetical protein
VVLCIAILGQDKAFVGSRKGKEFPFRKINKKFLETDHPRGKAIEVFRRTDSYRYHFGLRAKNRNFVFCPTRGRAVGEL